MADLKSMKSNQDRNFYLLTFALGALFFSVCCYTFVPNGGLYSLVLVGLSGALFLAWLGFTIYDRSKQNRLRGMKYGSNAFASIVIALALIVAANYIIKKHEYKKDLTAIGSNSLSEQTVSYLKGLQKDVKLTAFVASPYLMEPVKETVANFKYYSKGKVTTEFINPQRDPVAAKKYNVSESRPEVIVIEVGDARHTVESLTPNQLEEQLLNGIIKLTKGGKKKVYVLKGHGEHELADRNPIGMNEAKDAIEKTSFETKDLTFTEKLDIPEDAAVVIIAGPKKTPLATEVAALKKYLDGGGSVLFMGDPETPAEWNQVLNEYGVSLTKRIVLDEQFIRGAMQGAPVPAFGVLGYEYNKGTDLGRDFNVMTVFESAAEVEMAKEKIPAGVETKWIIKTHGNTWTKSNVEGLKNLQAVLYDKKSDKRGPFHLAVSSTKKITLAEKAEDKKPGDNADKKPKTKESRLLVFGDSDFASNRAFGAAGNRDMLLNAVSWLSKDEDLISVRPKPADQTSMDFQPHHMKMMIFSTFAVIPMVMFITAMAVWRRRLAL